MIGVVLTGHGRYAYGMADSLFLTMGQQENFAAIEFTPDVTPEELSAKIRAAADSMGEDGVLILCDMAGGTPFNETIKLLPQLQREVEVLAGISLPILVEACMDREDKTVHELAEQLLETGRSTLMRFVPDDGQEEEIDE